MKSAGRRVFEKRNRHRMGGAVSLPVVVGLWLAAVAAAYFWVSPRVVEMAVGIEPTQIPKFRAVVSLGIVMAAIVASVLWARGRGGAASSPAQDGAGRRQFLLGSAAVGGGLAATVGAIFVRLNPWFERTLNPIVNAEVVKTDPNPQPEWAEARVRAFRRLGRTGFEVSDISLGSGQITSTANGADGERIARDAIERGINYFDTAPDYAGAGSEKLLGRAMKGRRDQMFLATKFCTPNGHLRAGTSVEGYIEAVENSLRRLQTDYVDLVHIHSCDTVERLMDPNVHEAFDILKQQGKTRFLGFSSHTPNLVEVANASIESDRFDVMMLAYHHGSWPQMGDIIDRAHAADMGFVAMKTLKGAKHRGVEAFRGRNEAYSQAAFKWVLSNPKVSCLVVSFFEHQHVDEYLHASGQPLTSTDVAALGEYDRATAGTHCVAHCGECLDSCPEGVPIADVLRHRMYFEDYGRQKLAMEQYAKLEKGADACFGCPAPCAGSCPVGIDIQTRAKGAHSLLSMSS